jgi:energy-coupling factor transporter ATP-binding protein EcfA2
MIQAVGLTEKRFAQSRTLSGGQKRKLSVAIAFIGGSKVVFLDEPTSGMDPYSRRFTWNVIRNHREGRVVVLTTHFMDGADLLGDRIAIMGDGKLRCCGSSLFLKKAFGVGYNMTIEKRDPTRFDSAAMRAFVEKRVPDCKFLTDVGAEMVVQLPFGSSNKFASLFDAMDKDEAKLGIRSYGMSVTTLEEVFINVAKVNPFHQDGGAGPCCGLNGCPPCPASTAKTCPGCDNRKCPGFGCPPPPDRQYVTSIRKSDSKEGGLVDLLTLEDGGKQKSRQSTIVTDFGKLNENDQCGYFWRHLGAMLFKVRPSPLLFPFLTHIHRHHTPHAPSFPLAACSACCTSSATCGRGCSSTSSR